MARGVKPEHDFKVGETVLAQRWYHDSDESYTRTEVAEIIKFVVSRDMYSLRDEPHAWVKFRVDDHTSTTAVRMLSRIGGNPVERLAVLGEAEAARERHLRWLGTRGW